VPRGTQGEVHQRYTALADAAPPAILISMCTGMLAAIVVVVTVVLSGCAVDGAGTLRATQDRLTCGWADMGTYPERDGCWEMPDVEIAIATNAEVDDACDAEDNARSIFYPGESVRLWSATYKLAEGRPVQLVPVECP
jgi:hypothetical protein